MLNIIKQGGCICHVERIDENRAITSVNYISTDFDAYTSIVFDVSTYEIYDAEWAIHRAPDGERVGQGKAPMLIGESVCVEDRRLSVKVLPDYSELLVGCEAAEVDEIAAAAMGTPTDNVSPEWQKMRILFMEAVRGAFQVEPMLAKERGMGDHQGFQDQWIQGREGYCRPYNPPEGETVLTKWPDRTGPMPKRWAKNNLYKKYIQYTLYDMGDGTVQCLGHYNDNGHEMSAGITYESDGGAIVDMKTQMKRAPFVPCMEITGYHVDRFVGLNVYEIAKRDVGRIIGGPYGCFHMVDVVGYMVEGIQGL